MLNSLPQLGNQVSSGVCKSAHIFTDLFHLKATGAGFNSVQSLLTIVGRQTKGHPSVTPLLEVTVSTVDNKIGLEKDTSSFFCWKSL